jgi:protein-S-isoprenylcysteine O-methyltransferase Ste14
MPLRGYSTDNRPPTVLDHLLAHPYSIMFAVWQVIAGALAVLTTLFDFTVSSSMERLSQPLIAATGILFAVGGVQVVRGLLDDDDDLMQGWKIERTGLVLTIAAWLAFFVTIVWSFPGSVLTWLLCLLVGAGAPSLRLWATRREERRHRDGMRRAGLA